MRLRRVTLGFLIRDDEVLLGLKLRGFGVGKWNGFGGKVKEGESFGSALRREVMEEIGVEIGEMSDAGTLKFNTTDLAYAPAFDQICKVYVVKEWTGEPRKIEEMDPKWFKVDSLPFQQMWADDPFWLPHVLAGRTVNAAFVFDGHDGLLKKDVRVS